MPNDVHLDLYTVYLLYIQLYCMQWNVIPSFQLIKKESYHIKLMQLSFSVYPCYDWRMYFPAKSLHEENFSRNTDCMNKGVQSIGLHCPSGCFALKAPVKTLHFHLTTIEKLNRQPSYIILRY